jgi:hypothetical protein
MKKEFLSLMALASLFLAGGLMAQTTNLGGTPVIGPSTPIPSLSFTPIRPIAIDSKGVSYGLPPVVSTPVGKTRKVRKYPSMKKKATSVRT